MWSAEALSVTATRPLAWLVGLWLAGCGGGGADPAPVERTSEQRQCDSLMATWCDSALACIQSGLEPADRLTEEELAEEREYCLDVAKRTCDATGAVDERYDECLSDVETLDESACEDVRSAVEQGTDVAMPSSCDELFTSG
jgi:hypothetical protein